VRLAVAGFVAALLVAPLAARAADSPARYAVTLQATVADALTYERIHSEEECLTRRTGSGGRELTIRSVGSSSISVARGGHGAVYRPERIARVRIAGRALAGTFDQIRRCRNAPLERLAGQCDAIRLPVRLVRESFRRSGRNGIRFRALASRTLDLQACGLGRLSGGDALPFAPGTIDESALLSGRARVVARGSATRETNAQRDPETTLTRRTTVRWTLTFRRLR
jgi:hypothetical protein